MDRLSVLFLALFVAIFARAADSNELEDWKLVSDRNDFPGLHEASGWNPG